jgi:hypothetical protein
MNRSFLVGVLAMAVLAACSKPEPVVEPPRPVVVHTLALTPVAAGALYAGKCGRAMSLIWPSASAARSSSAGWMWGRW